MSTSKVIEKLPITGISSEGLSVGKLDGNVYFIKDGVPGDVVDIEVTGRKKKIFEARVTHFHTLSPDRISPACAHFGTCGGCKWQTMTYEAQLKHKHQHVSDNLRKLSGIDLPPLLPIIGSAENYFYRNKLEFTFSNSRWLTKEEINSGEELTRNGLGFHIPKRFDKILDVDKCWLQADPSNEIRNSLREFARREGLSFFDLVKQTGFLRNLIIRLATTGDLMVIVQFFYDDPNEVKKVMEFLKTEFRQITSLQYIINPKQNETFYELPVICYSGEPFITEKMGDLKFRIGPKSFYQTNSVQAHRLYQVAADFAGLTGKEVVYDLYTGTGTIANFVAKNALKVIGVESVEDAVKDARINSQINGIGNTTFIAGDMKDVMTKDFASIHGKPDVIITDPPRAGMHPDVIEAINFLKPKRLVYVSCNPATQARDFELLSSGFEVKELQPVDMFPQTHHVENVVLLELK